MAASSVAASSLKPCDSGPVTTTGLASFSSTMSGYDTQYGAHTITSSPGSRLAVSAAPMICLAPAPTVIWSMP
ncbi:hypothetical protein D3C78_1623490 [compost metagenome]